MKFRITMYISKTILIKELLYFNIFLNLILINLHYNYNIYVYTIIYIVIYNIIIVNNCRDLFIIVLLSFSFSIFNFLNSSSFIFSHF